MRRRNKMKERGGRKCSRKERKEEKQRRQRKDHMINGKDKERLYNKKE